MIKKIKKIKNLGLFSNYAWDNSLEEFSKFNVFYGWNGCGKTTLSKLFAGLETGVVPGFTSVEYDVELEGATCKENVPLNRKIRVFNSDYIQRNVQFVAGKANPIFILGEENKAAADQIEADTKALSGLEEQKRTKEEAKTKKDVEKGKKFTDVAKIIGANLVGSSTRDYRKPNAESDFARLQAKTLLKPEEVEVQQAIIRQEQKEKISKVEFKIDLDLSKLYSKVGEICKETVETNVIGRLAENPDVSKWVEAGLALHSSKSTVCEFCNSNIPKGRIEHLLGHFNEADKKLKEKIDSEVQRVEQTVQTVKDTSVPAKAQLYGDLQTTFTSRQMSYSQEKERFCQELAEILAVLQKKKQKTTEAVPFARSLSNGFGSAVVSLNEVIDQHNKKSDNFQSEKDKAVELLKTHHLSEIFDDVKNAEQEILKLSEEIAKIENDDTGQGGAASISVLKKRIAANKSKISSAHKACDLLNKQLQTFLGRNEIAFEVSSEGGYVLKRHGIVATNLSEGEKTAIAFVYFVVHLEDQDFKVADGFIVVDDPISSLDSSSLFQAFAFLKNAVKDAKQIFILTHNFNFLRLILDWLRKVKKQKRYYMIANKFVAEVRVAHIERLDRELEIHESEYHYLFKLLFNFKSDGSIASVYHIPNIARKVLDTFLMFRVPNGDTSYHKLEKLEFDENKKTAIYKFTNDQSHITGEGFDPSLVPETQKNVQYLLEMIEKTFPEHHEILVAQFSTDGEA